MPSRRQVRRIMMTADTTGGIWTYALELAKALEPHGVHVDLATMGAPMSEAQRSAVQTIQNLRISESMYRTEWMTDPWQDVELGGAWLMEIAYCSHPDVVHLNGYAHAGLKWPAPVLVVGHSCVCSWFRSVRQIEAPENWDKYRHTVRQGLQNAAMVAAPSRSMLMELRSLYGPLPPSRHIYNGRSPEYFPPGRKTQMILTAGRIWDEAKNIPALARVADRLSWPVYVAGSGGGPDNQETSYSGLRDVCSLGFLPQPELAEWMSRASIYALPARYEPFGLSALEAALAGCALVLGNIPSLHEVWGDAALFVDPDDDAELLSVMNSLIGNPAMLRDFATRARNLALQYYTPERMAEEYMKLYIELPASAPGLTEQRNTGAGDFREAA